MANQMQERQSDKHQPRERFAWILWIIIGIVLIAILAFAIAAILILENQGIMQGSTTLNLIYIVVATGISLLGLLFTFLQWFYPRHTSEHDTSILSSHLSRQRTIVGQAHPSQDLPLLPQPAQMIPHTILKVSQETGTGNDLLLEQSIKHRATIEPRFPSLHREDWGEAPYISQFYGREGELVELKRWIEDDHCRMIAIWGMGGIGKTSLSLKLVEQIKEKFEYVFWRSLQNAPLLRSILQSCIPFLSDQQRIDLPKDIDDQIEVLIQYLQDHRCLLILDNLETILQGGKHAGQYRKGYERYGKLIQRVGETKHRSCLLLTSREKPKEVVHLEGKTSPVRTLPLTGLKQEEGQELLKDKGLFGSGESWADLIRLYSGNPLSLKLASEPIRELFGGDVASFLKKGETIVDDIYDLLDHQFHRLSELEQEIMYWLAVEREAVSLDDLQEDIVHSMAKGALLGALQSLHRRLMIEISGSARFTLQPVVMEYVTNRLVEQACKAILSESVEVFGNHFLFKALAKDYVRDSHVRFILRPIAQGLLSSLGREEIEKKLKYMLFSLRQKYSQKPSYAAGNVLNLLIHLGCDLRGYDFSHLTMWQTYLRGVALPEVNFAYANLARSAFTETHGCVLSMAFSPNRQLLAAGTATCEVQLWQVPEGTPLLTWRGHTDWIRSVAFSPDGKMLASGSDDQTIRLWEASTGECLWTLHGHTNWVHSAVFSPDSQLLASGSDDQTIRLWDVRTDECLWTLHGHTNRIRSVVFSPDGQMLASGSDDQTVRLWETSSGHRLKTLQGHIDHVWSVTFSPDGRFLASGSEDQTIRLWEVSTGDCLKTLHGHTNLVRSVAFNPDGQILASSSEDGTIKLWDVQSGKCLKTLRSERPYERMNITGVRGLTEAQKASLIVLGAIEEE